MGVGRFIMRDEQYGLPTKTQNRVNEIVQVLIDNAVDAIDLGDANVSILTIAANDAQQRADGAYTNAVTAAQSDAQARADQAVTSAVSSANTSAVIREAAETTRALAAEGLRATTVVSKTATYAILSTDGTVLCNGTFTVTLPSAAVAGSGKTYVVKNIGSGVVTVASTAGTIDGATTSVLSTQYAVVTVQSNGANWWVI